MGVLTAAHPPLCPWADGELYAGTMNNFQGNEPIISRSLGTRTLLKTDAFLRWLSGEQREGPEEDSWGGACSLPWLQLLTHLPWLCL